MDMPMSGEEVLKLYLKDGWHIIHRKGSHISIAKESERETIPMHKELHRGLERKLLKRIGR
jgi:predicted RNA binding protein YcfA (HicA-like mRNA interferase family)